MRVPNIIYIPMSLSPKYFIWDTNNLVKCILETQKSETRELLSRCRDDALSLQVLFLLYVSTYTQVLQLGDL